MLVVDDGTVQSGLLLGETADDVELLTPEAKRLKISKSRIDERREQQVSPMPAGLVRNADELRDILAFLLRATP